MLLFANGNTSTDNVVVDFYVRLSVRMSVSVLIIFAISIISEASSKVFRHLQHLNDQHLCWFVGLLICWFSVGLNLSVCLSVCLSVTPWKRADGAIQSSVSAQCHHGHHIRCPRPQFPRPEQLSSIHSRNEHRNSDIVEFNRHQCLSAFTLVYKLESLRWLGHCAFSNQLNRVLSFCLCLSLSVSVSLSLSLSLSLSVFLSLSP